MALVLVFGLVLLFTDGQRASLPALREGWRLSGRALGLGMPMIMAGIAVPTHYRVGLDWPTACLVGATLSPTDPVFASAIVGGSDVPVRLRRLLNVESGLNDGLALPFVLIFLATARNGAVLVDRRVTHNVRTKPLLPSAVSTPRRSTACAARKAAQFVAPPIHLPVGFRQARKPPQLAGSMGLSTPGMGHLWSIG